MTTEIYEAIFTDGTWGRTTKNVLRVLRGGESIDGEGLKELGINIPNLGIIVDDINKTIIKAKNDKRVCFESLINAPFIDSEFILNKGFDIGVRTCGKVKGEVKGIQVVNIVNN